MAAEGPISASNGLPDFEKELVCSICTDLLYQPLTLIDCLHTFCGACLKEWFAWQATSAAHTRRAANPYTCPSCREPVKAAKPDFRVASYLDRILEANPDRGKTEQEKEDALKHYKPGDNVIPKVMVGANDVDSEDERLLADVRALSMATVDPGSRRRGEERNRRPAGQSAQSRISPSSPPPQDDTSHNDSHQVERQSSLRSLLSASPVNSFDVQQEILQSIYSEGLLDGIDIDNLTPEQEDELTERIAEAYRRRQRRRERSGNRDRRTRPSHSPQNSTTTTAEVSSTSQQATTDVAPSPPQPRPRPPISRPHLFESSAASQERSRHRGTSVSSQRSHHSANRVDDPTPISAASRSATDLSENPRTRNVSRPRHRRLSSHTRSATDPADSGMRQDIRRMREATNRPTAAATASSRTVPILDSDQTIRPVQSVAAMAPEPVGGPVTIQPTPSISCDRCPKTHIEHDLHYHCQWCQNGTYNLCLGCYRDGKGCNHWFGFGYMAYDRWKRLAPPEGWPSHYERPHVLTPRQYIRSTSTSNDSKDAVVLNEGAFCESCFTFTPDCYWYCYYCLEGAWGFCNTCVQQGRHCTHPLLCVSRTTTTTTSPLPPTKLLQLPHLYDQPHLPISTTTDCDICHRSIPPAHTRFHCYACSHGDFDICTTCYHDLIATGQIRRENGSDDGGWRRCPQGHRMALVGYQHVPERGGQQRVTVRGPVGGWRFREEEDRRGRGASSGMAPTDASLGACALAVWNRFPAQGVEDELAFPKNAEVREVEDVNADWCLGVYAGRTGLFPSNHVRKL